MKRLMILPLSLMLSATSVAAQSEKEVDCGYQADVAGAVQQARLDGVAERDVREAIEAGNPSWPDRYSNAIPVFAAQIYQIKKRDLKKIDLRAEWMTTCMTN
ncbi:hypothetical protein [Sedimentitalea arenosa]|nr:hypothetical protein [Arenibacterium arenosum]